MSKPFHCPCGFHNPGPMHAADCKLYKPALDKWLAAQKDWSAKFAVKAKPDPVCPKPNCTGSCAGTLNGLWCLRCGCRAYG